MLTRVSISPSEPYILLWVDFYLLCKKEKKKKKRKKPSLLVQYLVIQYISFIQSAHTKACIFPDIDDCEGQFCSGNGKCVDSVNQYLCSCNAGFTGKDCQIGKISTTLSKYFPMQIVLLESALIYKQFKLQMPGWSFSPLVLPGNYIKSL